MTMSYHEELVLSQLRHHETAVGELFKAVGVLNRKVETLHDELQELSFHKEEDSRESATPWNGVAHQGVQSLQTRAEADSVVVEETNAGDL